MNYHEAELQIALATNDSRHALPPHAEGRILDIGCGAGQSLIARYPEKETYGVDVDIDALRLGARWTNKVRFVCASAEQLPYAGESFDHVFSRVALPYTELPRSFAEILRILRPGGTVWLMFHPLDIAWQSALSKRSLKGWLYFGYVAGNGLIFHLTGRVFRARGRMESFQTPSGVQRALERSGFQAVTVIDAEKVIVTARKPAR